VSHLHFLCKSFFYCYKKDFSLAPKISKKFGSSDQIPNATNSKTDKGFYELRSMADIRNIFCICFNSNHAPRFGNQGPFPIFFTILNHNLLIKVKPPGGTNYIEITMTRFSSVDNKSPISVHHGEVAGRKTFLTLTSSCYFVIIRP